MTLDNLIKFTNTPEYILDNMWFVEIIDDTTTNTILFQDINGKFDSYVSDINIPQESLKVEKTSFGVPIFDGQGEYEQITINFHDDIKCTISNFFQSWIDSIYNRYKRQLKNNRRNQYKTINVYLVTIRNKHINRINSFINHINNVNLSSYEICAKYEIVNCFPTSLENISLSESSSGDRLQFNVTLECERMNPYYGDNIDS